MIHIALKTEGMNNKVILAVVAITFAACITAKPRGPLHYNDKVSFFQYLIFSDKG